jgi:DNA-binding transcriptional LysR family regulator
MMKPGLSLHRLELFLAVLDTGGVVHAARSRHISQPAVSEHLRGLEGYFGIRLFERAGRRLQPTAAARELEPFARQTLGLLREAERRVGGVRRLERGALLVGASTTPGTYLLPTVLGRFHTMFPGITLNLRIQNSRAIERGVLAGQVDFGVVGESPLLTGLSAERWVADELVLIVGRTHPLARRRSLDPRRLIGERFIAREAGSSTRAVAEQYLGRLGVQLVPEMELGSTEAIREAVAAGLGVALISRLAVRDRNVRAVMLAGPRWRRDLLIIRREATPLSPAAAKLHDMLLHDPEAIDRTP